MRELIDLARLDEISEGDPDFQVEIIEMCIEDMGQLIPNIRKAWETGDLATMKKMVHTAKGASGNLGLMPVHNHLKQLEEQIIQTNQEEMTRHIAQTESVYEESTKALRELLSKLTSPSPPDPH